MPQFKHHTGSSMHHNSVRFCRVEPTFVGNSATLVCIHTLTQPTLLTPPPPPAKPNHSQKQQAVSPTHTPPSHQAACLLAWPTTSLTPPPTPQVAQSHTRHSNNNFRNKAFRVRVCVPTPLMHFEGGQQTCSKHALCERWHGSGKAIAPAPIQQDQNVRVCQLQISKQIKRRQHSVVLLLQLGNV